jgi:hypothetical protein
MNINYKRSIKFITLLITALLIATVSAQIYSYMYIEGSGTITSAELSWELGSYAPTGATIDGYTVKNLNLSIPANNPKNITDCLRIVNNDDSNGYTFSLEILTVGGDSSNFTTFDLVLYNSGGSRLATLNVKMQGNSASGLSIVASETQYIRFEVTPLTDKTEGYFYFTVKLTYEKT